MLVRSLAKKSRKLPLDVADTCATLSGLLRDVKDTDRQAQSGSSYSRVF